MAGSQALAAYIWLILLLLRVSSSATAGRKRWSFQAEGPVGGSPTIGSDGQTIFVGSDDRNMYAFSKSGEVLWKFSAGGKVFSSIAIGKDGVVYFGSADNCLYGIYSNGTKRFSFKTGGTVYGGPAISPDQTLYFGSLDNYTYALFPNGTIKWKFKSGAVYGQPRISKDGKVIYVGAGKSVQAISMVLR